MIDHQRPFMGSRMTTGLLLLAITISGCYSSNNGPERYELSGNVTFDGKPVPLGNILFTPDRDKGNMGPGAFTEIKNGEFKTMADKGTIGGPMKVEIVGWDGVPYVLNGERIESGKELFRAYRFDAEVPKENARLDFEVPQSAK